MRILALDLGTSLGYAYGDLPTGAVLRAGTVKLATAKEITEAHKTRMNRRLDPRLPALFNWLTSFNVLDGIDWVVFEDVEFSSFTQQTQLWSSFRAAVWVFAAQNRVDVECINVKALKKFGGGHGSSDKARMADRLCAQYKDFSRAVSGVMFQGKVLNDDAVDAVHLLKWAQTILKNTTK